MVQADSFGHTARVFRKVELAEQPIFYQPLTLASHMCSESPFGNIIAQSGPLADANVYRFSSKEYHVQSGLYYFGRRFYVPSLQRWLNRDPKGISGGVNLYRFCGNGPITFIDPDGQFSLISLLQMMPNYQDLRDARSKTIREMIDYEMLTPHLFKAADEFNALFAYNVAAISGNRQSGGVWAQEADDAHVTAYQMFFQFVNGTGKDTRNFDENSVMGSQMLQASFVQAGIQTAVQRALNGNTDKVGISSALKDVPDYLYPFQFVNNAMGDNPALAFQGTISGSVTPGLPVVKDGVISVPIVVSLSDQSSAESATRLPPVLGGYSENNPLRAIFTVPNPLGPRAPFRTITEIYTLRTTVTIPMPIVIP